jgi:hypothetical protein
MGNIPRLNSNSIVRSAGAALQPQVVINAVQQYLQEEAIYGGYETAARYADTIRFLVSVSL